MFSYNPSFEATIPPAEEHNGSSSPRTALSTTRRSQFYSLFDDARQTPTGEAYQKLISGMTFAEIKELTFGSWVKQ